MSHLKWQDFLHNSPLSKLSVAHGQYLFLFSFGQTVQLAGS